MWVQQRIGPFPANKIIVFPNLAKKDEGRVFPYKYIRIGIQSPQSPYVTETRDIEYNWNINGSPVLNSGIKVIDTSTVNRMRGFKIGFTGISMKPFYINENEILEFDDLSGVEYFKVAPMQDVDEYSIVEIQYLDNIAS